MLSNSFQYNSSMRSLGAFVLRPIPLNDVSCSHSGSQVDPPPIAPPKVNGVVSSGCSSGCASGLSCSPKDQYPFSHTFNKDDKLQDLLESPG